ncbi:AbgT family transporter [Atopococcus tabaci]|uniref:AbgT family transporter n=1 Tax=Atopococcus tabaci TaxID=269774 RepID=UPI0004234EC4|nr:AbgT family transporter [Atopococcus tabaci]
MKKNKKINIGLLKWLERVGNKLPDPAFLFVILAVITMVASAVAAQFDLSVTYEGVNSATGTIETITTTVNNLLSVEGLHYIVTNAVTNFTSFFPLGTVFTVILGVSVMEGTGMLAVLLRRIVSKTPKTFISAMVVFLGVMSNIASSTGYIVLVPLGAIIFLASKRHPIAGLAAAYAGVSGGWTANLLLGSNDPLYAGISSEAARILDPSYTVLPTDNWFFMIASTFLVTIVGTFVTDRIIEPSLPEYEFSTQEEVEDITPVEKKGLLYAGIAEAIYLLGMAWMVLPENGLLRNPETGEILNSPFMSGIIFFLMLFFLIPGIAYGIGSGVIKRSQDVTELMTKGIQGISNFLVLIFWAAQFTAIFGYSNLGIILSVNGAQWLTQIGLTGLPLLLLFILLAALIDFIMPVDTAKWALMAPIFVPMFMQVGLSPEATQLTYRIGDSTTNIITPLMPFFPMIIAFFQKYDKKAGIGTVVSTMLPYSLSFLVGWLILLSIWYLLGLAIGPGAWLTL